MTKKNSLIIIIVICISFILTLGLSFKYETRIKAKSNSIESIYFTGKIFNYYIFGNKDSKSPLKTRIIGLSKEEVEIAGLLKSKINNYVVFTKKNIIMLYDIKQNDLITYEVDSGDIIISTFVSDIDNNFSEELLMISGKRSEVFGDSLVILSMDEELKEIYKKKFKDMNPWMVQTADVDGDGIKEIALGVYKKSEFHPVMAKRPFIYNWNGKDIYPKWRGSRLSRPFEDYIFGDIDGDGLDEIISIENLNNGKKIVNSYKWKGFGFEGMAESKEYEDILDIKRVSIEEDTDNIVIKTRKGKQFEWILLHYADEKLEMKRKLRDYILEIDLD